MRLGYETRHASSGGSWEPCSKKEFEFQENLEKNSETFVKITVLQISCIVFSNFGKLSLTSTIFFGNYQNLLVRTQFILTLFYLIWFMSKIMHTYSTGKKIFGPLSRFQERWELFAGLYETGKLNILTNLKLKYTLIRSVLFMLLVIFKSWDPFGSQKIYSIQNNHNELNFMET